MLIHHLNDIKIGFFMGFGSIIPILSNRILRSHLLTIIIYTIITAILLYSILYIILLLPKLILFIFNIHLDSKIVHDSVDQIQSIGMLFIRYLYPQPIDTLFYESMLDYSTTHRHQRGIITCQSELLKLQDSSLYALFRGFVKNPRGSVTARLLKSIKRSGKRVGLLLLCYLASFVPGIGSWVFPTVTFYYLRSRLGTDIAIVVLLSSFHPVFYKYIKTNPLSFITSLRQLCIELLEPVRKVDYGWVKKHQWFLMGCVACYVPFFSIPMLGPIVFCILQCIVGYSILSLDYPIG